MRRPGWYRAFLALWGLWFTTALTEPAGILACAMHSGVPGAALRVTHGGGGAHAAFRHVLASDAGHAASHREAGHAASHRGASNPASQSHDCCTCLGQCCTAAPVAAPAGAVALAAIVHRAAPAHEFARHERAPSPRAYVLPFANAPPAAAHV